MWHLMKYEFKQTIREFSIMFWAIAFPIILGTFFYVSFGSGDMGEEMESIPVAVVEEDASGAGQAFLIFLENIEGSVVETETMKEEDALRALAEDEISGIFYVKEKPSLTVAKSDISQSILKAFLDAYNRNAEMIITIAKERPEKLGNAIRAMSDWHETTQDVSVGGRTLNPTISYFFALIAYACLSGAFIGVKGCCDSQANISPLGARRCITPTHKMKLLLSTFFVLLFVHFCDIMILTGFIRFVLGIDLGGNIGGIILVNFMGSLIGVSIGILLGSVSRLSFNWKTGICVLVSVFPGFLAGLMIGDMKNIIEKSCPIINRINPAAVLSDAYYCMAVYNDTQRMARNLIILGCMAALFVLISFFATRRERYDSI